MVNAELGRRVLDHVIAHRDQFDMGWWGERDPVCGTKACLAGHAMLLSGYTLYFDGRFIRPDGTAVPPSGNGDEAAQLLGLTDIERYGPPGAECSVFAEFDEDAAIARFRAIVEAAEAATKVAEG